MKTILILTEILILGFSDISAQTGLSSFTSPQYESKNISYLLYDNFAMSRADSSTAHKYSIINLSGQAVVGSALAVVFSIVPLGAALANAWGHPTDASQTALGILAIYSYLFGGAVGVHWVAKAENPELSLWGTFGYSAIGGGVGALLATYLASQYTTMPPVGAIAVALCPVIGSMLYASFVSDWPKENKTTYLYPDNISHKDLFEQTKLFNIEVLRIRL